MLKLTLIMSLLLCIGVSHGVPRFDFLKLDDTPYDSERLDFLKAALLNLALF